MTIPTAPPPVAMAIPFVVLLLAIALLPVVWHRGWRRAYPWVSGLCAVGIGGYYIFGAQNIAPLMHSAQEYLSFITLIGALYVISGGLYLQVKGEATPLANTLFLLTGAALSNLIGTTGASMLLIQPWLRMNRYRVTGYHVVFFIFLVSNAGGCLTPVGDPPLFLGFLKGVPFWWPLRHLWPAWLFVMGTLLAVFYVFDRRNFLRAPPVVRVVETHRDAWAFRGGANLLLLAFVLLAVLRFAWPWRELMFVLAAVASWAFTPRSIHTLNRFEFHPLREVAWLFLGLFATMRPALDLLAANAASLPLDSPHQYYWLTGSLSSVLDNAPTYLSFLTTSVGHHAAVDGGRMLSLAQSADVLRYAATWPRELAAISLGAVFFGAMTYIGNGPNFMVKSIADAEKVHTPNFLEYLLRYALPILLPILALAGWLFI